MPSQRSTQNKHVIFTGNGYSAEWPVEASKRGLPNLNTTPKAIATWSSEKNTKLLETLKIYTKEETGTAGSDVRELHLLHLPRPQHRLLVLDAKDQGSVGVFCRLLWMRL